MFAVMSAGTAGPSGVRNLRAMFETKGTDQSSSPPSRGRSPNGSISSVTSRPVSKVRSSFVAVERPGEAGQPTQWGLRKASDVSSMAEVARENAIMEEEMGENTALVTSESANSAQDVLDLGAILKGSPFETSPPRQLPITAQVPKTETESHLKNLGPKVNGTTGKVSSILGKMQEPQTSKVQAPSRIGKPAPSNIDTSTSTAKSKESPTLVKKSPTLQRKPQNSPTATSNTTGTFKPKGGVNKILGVMQSANKAKEERAKAEQTKLDGAAVEQADADEPAEEKRSPTVTKAPSVASKGTAASRAHAQRQERAKDEAQVKSPTASRPVKLPSAATATTAAYAARKNGTTESEDSKAAPRDRKSLNVQAPRVANTATKASLARKSSRASLAPNEERTRSRVSAVHKPADEGFLARMTRPTASSAQRAHETLQASSPPRTRKTTEHPKKTAKRSLNTSMKRQEPVDAAPSADGTELGEETILESTSGEQPDVLEDDEGEPGPAEENDAYNQPQQAAVNGHT